VPDELVAIANRATHLEPSERYRSADAFRNAIAEFLLHRASLRLSAAANERLDELESLVGTTDPNDAHRLHLLVGECRFGFGQALDEWPDNPEAAHGLDQVQLHALEHALQVGQADRAEVILGEFTDPPAAAVARIEAIRTQEASRGARPDTGTRRVSSTILIRARIMLGLSGIWGLGLGLLAVLEPLLQHGAAMPALGIVIAAQALAVAATAVRRASVLQQGPHYRSFGQLLALGAFIPVLLWPVMATVTGTVASSLLAFEISLVLVFGAAAFGFDRRLWVSVGLLLLACLMTSLVPEWSLAFASLGIGGAYVLCGLVWRRVA
jgi:hypothetical protein